MPEVSIGRRRRGRSVGGDAGAAKSGEAGTTDGLVGESDACSGGETGSRFVGDKGDVADGGLCMRQDSGLLLRAEAEEEPREPSFGRLGAES